MLQSPRVVFAMDTDTRLCAPSAGASSARADGAPAITATENDRHMESAAEFASFSGSGFAARTAQTLKRCLHDFLVFFVWRQGFALMRGKRCCNARISECLGAFRQYWRHRGSIVEPSFDIVN